MKNILLIVLLFLVYGVNGQSGNLKGIITDDTGEVLMFVTIVVQQDGKSITGTQTDFDGKYELDSLTIGTYDIEVSYVGYSNKKISNVVIFKDKTITLNIEMMQGVIIECPIYRYYPSLYDADDLTQGTTLFSNEIRRSPHKN